MSTIFTKIIHGEIPCYKVGEDADNFAFLDINPLVVGHTLVVSKTECDYIFDLDAHSYESLMRFAARVARVIGERVECKRVAMVVLGLDVPHVHIHLIPINSAGDVDFAREKLKLTEEEFRHTAQLLSL